MSQESTTAVERRRSHLKFSLRTLLFLLVAACVALGYYRTSRRMREAEREVRIRRDETGYLTVEDRTQFHAIVVDSHEPNTWRWRLFVPKGHRYSWNISCRNIPQDGVPHTAGAMGVSNESYWETDNEVLVTAQLRQLDDVSWQLSVKSRIGDSKEQMAGATLKIAADKLRWMSETPGRETGIIGNRGTEVCDAKGPIVLLRQRACERQPDGTFQPSSDVMPGFMIWLEARP